MLLRLQDLRDPLTLKKIPYRNLELHFCSIHWLFCFRVCLETPVWRTARLPSSRPLVGCDKPRPGRTCGEILGQILEDRGKFRKCLHARIPRLFVDGLHQGAPRETFVFSKPIISNCNLVRKSRGRENLCHQRADSVGLPLSAAVVAAGVWAPFSI